METPKKLYVVFDNYIKEVAFITGDKSDIENFFRRPKRQEKFFYKKITDKKHIELFMRDFPDSYPVCEGKNVMTEDEYISMCEATYNLSNDLLSLIADTVKYINYINLSGEEFDSIICMCKILYERLIYEPEMDEEDDVFNEELLRERYLDDIGE